MSRSGYSDDCDGWALIRWRGAVKSAIRGKRGQAVLREIAQALDALPEKVLAAESLVTSYGDFCTLGALGRARGLDLSQIDPDDRDCVASAFGIPEALAAEIMFLNDECEDEREYFNFDVEGPMRQWESHRKLRWRTRNGVAEARWAYMRRWVHEQIMEKEKA